MPGAQCRVRNAGCVMQEAGRAAGRICRHGFLLDTRLAFGYTNACVVPL